MLTLTAGTADKMLLKEAVPLFGMEPRLIQEMFNFAQTLESHEVKKVTALKEA
ncbi:MAG: hypothetical protein WCF68_19285 [Terriglobales bacterium]